MAKKTIKAPAVPADDWISPGEAMDMLYDDPMGGTPGFGFALLRPRARQRDNAVAALVTAKLQPRRPEPGDPIWMGVPMTASRAALVLAPGVPDVHEPLDQWLTRYDEAVPAHLRLLAIVLSPTLDASMPAHDMMSAAVTYAELNLSRARRLTSIVSLHLPGENLSRREPHAHITVLARVHLPCGFGHVHADLILEEEGQALFYEEWQGYQTSWGLTLRQRS